MRRLGDLSSASISAFAGLLKLFNVAGFFNFPLILHQTAGLEIGERRCSTVIWWLFHCLYTIFSCVMAKIDYNCLYYGLELTDAMNNYFSADIHRSIWKCYQTLAVRNGTYLGLLDRSSAAAAMRWVLKIFVSIVITSAVVQCKAFSTLIPGTQWQYFLMYSLYPVTLSYMRHVFHLLHITLMCANLKQLHAKLEHLRRTVDDSLKVENITLNPRKHEATVLTTLKRLEDCRLIYTELWHANDGINELFGFSQAFNVACSFVQIAFDLYWVQALWISGNPDLELQLLLSVPTPVIIGFLMHTTRNYHLAVESVKLTLLEMPCMHDERMVQMRGYFLGQLQRFRFRLSARNIFEFDNTLLPKFVFVIVTYIIIFIEINRR